MNHPYVGRTVALVGCESDAVLRKTGYTLLNGLFDVVEFLPREPSNYVWSDQFLVVPVGETDSDKGFFVLADDLWAQVDPQGYGESIAQERWMTQEAEIAEENLALR